MSSSQSSISAAVGSPHRIRIGVVVSLVLLGVIVAAAAWLRLHALGAKSLWMDEGLSAGYMRMDWYNLARLLWRREANMSFYFLLLSGWIQFGDSVAWYRGLSVLMAVATVPVMYLTGKRLFGTAAGLISSALMAVSAYHVRYAQEARSYALAIFLVTLASYFFVRAMDDGRRGIWRGYIVCSALAVYSHFFAVLIVAAHWTSLRALPSKQEAGAKEAVFRREFVRAARRIGLWTLPVWVFIATTGVGVLSWMRRPGLHELYQLLEQYAGNGGLPLLGLYLLCGTLAAIAALQSWRRHGRSIESWRYGVSFTWLVVPVLIILAATLARPMFLPRYLSICLPALFLTAAAGLSFLKPRWLVLPVLGLMLWLAVGGIRSYYEKDFDVLRADYRLAAGYVLENAHPGDAILFYPGYGRFAYDYYVAHLPGAYTKPAIAYPGHSERPMWRDFMGQASPQVLDAVTRDYRRVWFVLSNYTGPESEDRISRQIETAIAGRFHLKNTHDFPGIRLYLYAPEESAPPLIPH